MSSVRPAPMRRRSPSAQQLQEERSPASSSSPAPPISPASPASPTAPTALGPQRPARRRMSLIAYPEKANAVAPEMVSMTSVQSAVRRSRPTASSTSPSSLAPLTSPALTTSPVSPASPTLPATALLALMPKQLAKRCMSNPPYQEISRDVASETVSMSSMQSTIRSSKPLASFTSSSSRENSPDRSFPSSPPPRMPKQSSRQTKTPTTKVTADSSRRKNKPREYADAMSDIVSTTGSQKSATRRDAPGASDPRVNVRGRSPQLPDIKESWESGESNSTVLKTGELNKQHTQEEAVKAELLESRTKARRGSDSLSTASKSTRRRSDAEETAQFFNPSLATPLQLFSDTARTAIATVMHSPSRPVNADPGYGTATPFTIAMKKPQPKEGVKKQKQKKKSASSAQHPTKSKTSGRARSQTEDNQNSQSTHGLLFMVVQTSKKPEVARAIDSLNTGKKEPAQSSETKSNSDTRLTLTSSLQTLSLSLSSCSVLTPADAQSEKTDSISEKSLASGAQKIPKSVRLNALPIDEEPPQLVRKALLPKGMRPDSNSLTRVFPRASENYRDDDTLFRREFITARSTTPNSFAASIPRSFSSQIVHKQRVPKNMQCPVCKNAGKCDHLPLSNLLFPMFAGRRSLAAGSGTRVVLHAHLEGSVRYETVWELMKSKKLKLPGDGSLRAIREALISTTPVGTAHYWKHIPVYLQAFAGDMQALERLAFEFCEDKVKQGVLYAEARYIPHLLMNKKKLKQGKLLKDLSEVVMAVNRGFKKAEIELRITVRSILCIAVGMNNARDIIKLCERFQNDGVVGIDLMLPCFFGENDDSSVLYEEVPLTSEELRAFETATLIGIKRTVHAGQSGSVNMVERAVVKYCAQRLGHGYEVLKKPGLYVKCRDQNVHFECCPWDSLFSGAVHSGIDKHPIARFAEDGVNFGLNNSYPTLTGLTLQQVYDLATSWGLTEAHIVRANINALRSSFLPQAQKEQLMQTLLENLGIKRRRNKE